MLPWRSKVIYDDATELVFTWTTPKWKPDDDAEGGTDKSAGGIVESYLIRWDYITALRLPFFESQIAAVRAFIRWAQTSGQSFEFWFDADDEDTAHDYYLDSPSIAEGFKPEEDEFVGMF